MPGNEQTDRVAASFAMLKLSFFFPPPVSRLHRARRDAEIVSAGSGRLARCVAPAPDKRFLEVIKEAHARGIGVIIDGVFNHTGRDFFAFQNLRKNQARSRYEDRCVVESFDDPKTKRNEFLSKGWWSHATLPVFAPSADGKDMLAGPKAYIMQATKRWMLPDEKDPSLGIDGWRLDVADERASKFWADWNAFVRRCNPNAYTVAEIWKGSRQP